ncbi:MAG: Pr6Pr family membrane protein [Phreatobacter sp.]|uniref:Pr6Pr family membrane protein n=1 Tax=Phreatobacter sp. TaxID=1966341 RepID=UPI001A5FA865|nr:Pr6Pr family membrane protein [Phreatobacter sp.]MBL8569676.1 Pr6Pr family membrane protein [Phreatobacter sp.]
MTDISPAGRLTAGVVATAGFFGLALQLVLIIGTTTASGGTATRAIFNFFCFFTILSNAIVTAVLTRVALGKAPAASWLGATTLYIAVVGITYSVALRHIWNPQGWQLVADHALHDVVPVLAVLFWLVFVPKGRLSVRIIPFWLIFPVGYLGWSLARGAVDGWYPYYFIDAGKLGYAVMARNALLVTALFALVALAVVGIDRLPGQRRG